ncbi:MAG: hypothetical protein HZA53_02125 [Planctomycetes bacterium]|nr:hypothetical protein [Planctomycetota bacterium]
MDVPAAHRTRLVVMGMIHGEHRTSARYSTAVIADAIERIGPDVVLCEIPPDRLVIAQAEFARTGTITEPRVRVFPEYVDVLFPLSRARTFEIVPCAAWSKPMSDDRAAKLEAWRTTRPAESAEVEAADKRSEARLAAESAKVGLTPDDPLFIHTDLYDAITKEGLEPYDRLFNEDLGAGGWTNINVAHYALIEKALDAQRDTGRTVLIMFGAGHKTWFMDHLRQRTDVELIDARQYFAR